MYQRQARNYGSKALMSTGVRRLHGSRDPGILTREKKVMTTQMRVQQTVEFLLEGLTEESNQGKAAPARSSKANKIPSWYSFISPATTIFEALQFSKQRCTLMRASWPS